MPLYGYLTALTKVPPPTTQIHSYEADLTHTQLPMWHAACTEGVGALAAYLATH